jgi:hypothetical protein
MRPRRAHVRGGQNENDALLVNNADVLGFFALLAGRGVEFDSLALFEVLVALALNVGKMDENVIALLTGNETKSLVSVKKLHSSLCHKYSILCTTDQLF